MNRARKNRLWKAGIKAMPFPKFLFDEHGFAEVINHKYYVIYFNRIKEFLK